ncbi:MAG: class I SAM-dependent methyltransferase [Acidimicrobiia bacterium]|jgi:hypothetical protein
MDDAAGVDLEALAAGYLQRPASEASRHRARRAAAEASLQPGDWAVDVGGGTGAQAACWAEDGVHAIVVDPSRGMLRRAAARPGVHAVGGRAQALPLATGTVRLVTFHLSIHYGDWRRAIDEAMRVLCDGGECWVWTLGGAHHRASFLARWFPSVAAIDTARFPDPDALADRFAGAGGTVDRGTETEVRERSAAAWLAAVDAGFVSTLQLIPAEELRAGRERFVAAHPDPAEVVRYRLDFDWLRTRK